MILVDLGALICFSSMIVYAVVEAITNKGE